MGLGSQRDLVEERDMAIGRPTSGAQLRDNENCLSVHNGVKTSGKS